MNGAKGSQGRAGVREITTSRGGRGRRRGIDRRPITFGMHVSMA